MYDSNDSNELLEFIIIRKKQKAFLVYGKCYQSKKVAQLIEYWPQRLPGSNIKSAGFFFRQISWNPYDVFDGI